MQDFALVRQNMIDGQIKPAGVTCPLILDAFLNIPRERFVPDNLRSVAYVDEDLRFGDGRYLMEPRIFAKLLQLAGLKPSDACMVIGCGTGYSLAVIASISGAVIGVESDPDYARWGQEVLEGLAVDNTLITNSPIEQGYPAQAPYDVIFIGGGVHAMPDHLIDQLADGGRLVCVVVDEVYGPQGEGIGHATVLTRRGNSISSQIFFDVFLPVIPHFKTRFPFVF